MNRPTAYYNEHDPRKAEWLRENIKADLIAPGDVDERSIVDVWPGDVAGYCQCHWFAGIGIWSYALRLAGWPDTEPVWTGSCPCQPFSAAGQRKGTEDERHLFPVWFRLIQARRPVTVFGEQVSDGDGLAWLDAVHAGMDEEGYTLGVVDTCAAGFGAPHRRQRLYFVAQSEHAERRSEHAQHGVAHGRNESGRSSATGGMADAELPEWRPFATGRNDNDASEAGWNQGAGWAGERGAAGILGDAEAARHEVRNGAYEQRGADGGTSAGSEQAGDSGELADDLRTGCGVIRTPYDHNRRDASGYDADGRGPTNGFWADAEWIWCRDGKWRAIEPGTFPLAHGAAARILRLRGYGDGIVAPQAAAFVRVFRDLRREGLV